MTLYVSTWLVVACLMAGMATAQERFMLQDRFAEKDDCCCVVTARASSMSAACAFIMAEAVSEASAQAEVEAIASGEATAKAWGMANATARAAGLSFDSAVSRSEGFAQLSVLAELALAIMENKDDKSAREKMLLVVESAYKILSEAESASAVAASSFGLAEAEASIAYKLVAHAVAEAEASAKVEAEAVAIANTEVSAIAEASTNATVSATRCKQEEVILDNGRGDAPQLTSYQPITKDSGSNDGALDNGRY